MTTAPDGGAPAGDHYFSARPGARSAPRAVRVRLGDADVRVITDAGVFSAARLDPGTRLLIERAPAPAPSGDLLDLGCGWGPLALALARRSPGAAVWAVDVNDRALELCRANAAANGLRNVRAVRPDEVPAEVSFRTIWSNPPIRIGKPALHELLLRWLGRLAPEGEAVLVVNKNLGADSLQRWLGDQGHPTERLASSQGYRILHTQTAPGV